MFFTRILLLILAFLGARRVLRWFSEGGSARVSSAHRGPVRGRPKSSSEIVSEQKIEEADYEELPEDRTTRES